MNLPSWSDDAARKLARATEREAGRPARGKEAEAEFIQECNLLRAQGRLFWLRIPDPLIPAPKARKVRGAIPCIPCEREMGTDFVGAALPAGRMIGVEVKSFYTPSAKGAEWSHSELRNAQVNALEAMAKDGLPAFVWLVHYHQRGAVRYLLPWMAGVGLPGAKQKKTVLDLGVEEFRQERQEFWLDVAQRLEAGGDVARVAVRTNRITGDALDDELILSLGERRQIRIAPSERKVEVGSTTLTLPFRPHPEWRRSAVAFAGAALHAEMEPHASRLLGRALADHPGVAKWLRFEEAF